MCTIPVMIAAYVRVSSRSQSLEMQRSAIARAAKQRGDRIGEWFEEKTSARTLERPALQALRARARLGAIKKFYVYRLDRLTRSGIRDTLGLLQEFKAANCEIVSIADGFTFSGSPELDVVTSVIAWAAQMERLAIGERICAARERARAQGKHWGRRRAVLDGKVREIRKLSDQGVSIRGIAQRLHVARSTVSDVLTGKGPYGQQATSGQKTKRVRSLSG